MMKIMRIGLIEMKDLEILEVFTAEDIEFNRQMVDRALDLQIQRRFPDRRGGKMSMKHQQGSNRYVGRNCDYTSEVLSEFRRKWGILE